MLTTPVQIERYRLSVLVRGIRLESLGMKISRGRSCSTIARGILKAHGIKAARARDDLLIQFEQFVESQPVQ